jgi:flagellar biosynthesis/type III secretory pathway ATPase
LDGHIILSRDLAARNQYPAIDILNSISRVMPYVTAPEHLTYAYQVRKLMATYEKARDLINIGAYAKGSDPEIDVSIAALPDILSLLQQKPDEFTPLETTLSQMEKICIGD